MPNCIRLFVRYVDAVNRLVGRVVLYLVFVMMAVLLYSAISRYFFHSPVIWGVEMAQFCMVAYYLLGGGFALLVNSHVRMDVFYGRMRWRNQARMDVFTSFFLVVYLVMLLYGGLSSTWYSIEFNQRNNTAWGPSLAPIKILMALGIALTLLQSISEFFKAVARSRGLLLGEDIPERLIVETGSAEPDTGSEAEDMPGSPVMASEMAAAHR